jgi:hypothetical protein
MSETKEFWEGYADCMSGKPFSDNPYSFGSDKSINWNRGYIAAEFRKEQEQ